LMPFVRVVERRNGTRRACFGTPPTLMGWSMRAKTSRRSITRSLLMSAFSLGAISSYAVPSSASDDWPGQKSGIYALNPDTGTVLWDTKVGPGLQLGGMEWGSASDGKRIYVAIGNRNGVKHVAGSAGRFRRR